MRLEIGSERHKYMRHWAAVGTVEMSRLGSECTTLGLAVWQQRRRMLLHSQCEQENYPIVIHMRRTIQTCEWMSYSRCWAMPHRIVTWWWWRQRRPVEENNDQGGRLCRCAAHMLCLMSSQEIGMTITGVLAFCLFNSILYEYKLIIINSLITPLIMSHDY